MSAHPNFVPDREQESIEDRRGNLRPVEKRAITVAVAGNPNSGKSTLINAIAGTRLQVGNWAGVTVEKKEAVFRYQVFACLGPYPRSSEKAGATKNGSILKRSTGWC